MVNSMTGFASTTGQTQSVQWALEVKSVNARGLDIRSRLFQDPEGLEQLIKSEITKVVTRGSVSVSLKTNAVQNGSVATLNEQAARTALSAAMRIEHLSMDYHLELGATKAADLLAIPGVYDNRKNSEDGSELTKSVKAALPALIKEFVASRAQEGAALSAILESQIDEMAKLVISARKAAGARSEKIPERIANAIKEITASSESLEPARLEQELALIAFKGDVTEELDRLDAHIEASKQLIKADSVVGRKFDFLMQEFNREANTLCSKSGSTDLTRIGLDLKTVIDQMREQVQNVE